MQEQIDYVTVENTSSAAVDGISVMDRGLFVGTKNYLFFIPEKLEEYTTKNITKTTLFLGDKLPSEIIKQKLEEIGLRVSEFESFVINEIAPYMKIGVTNLELDVDQLKVTANFFGGAIYTNTTMSKVGWKGFVIKTGKKKKQVREFYQNHFKLSNK